MEGLYIWQIPVGIIVVFPGSILTGVFILAERSRPDDPLVSYFGNIMSFDSLLIKISVIN